MKQLRISKFGGVDTYNTPSQIALGRASDLNNVVANQTGQIDKREGFVPVTSTAETNTDVTGFFYNDETGKYIECCGTKMYLVDVLSGNKTEIYNGLTAGAKVRSFSMGGRQFFINGYEYLVFDGKSCGKVSDSAYVPVTYTWKYNTAESKYLSVFNQSYNLVNMSKTIERYDTIGAVGKDKFYLKEKNLYGTPKSTAYGFSVDESEGILSTNPLLPRDMAIEFFSNGGALPTPLLENKTYRIGSNENNAAEKGIYDENGMVYPINNGTGSYYFNEITVPVTVKNVSGANIGGYAVGADGVGLYIKMGSGVNGKIFDICATRRTNGAKWLYDVAFSVNTGSSNSTITVIIDGVSYSINTTSASTSASTRDNFYTTYKVALEELGWTVRKHKTVFMGNLYNNTKTTYESILFEKSGNLKPTKFDFVTTNIDHKIIFYTRQQGAVDTTSLLRTCTIASLYGGQNDTRVFFSGNTLFPNREWKSQVLDPFYVPDDSYSDIGSNDEKIVGYATQYDTQVVFKERSIWNKSISYNSSGEAIFPVRPINDQIGCDYWSSIQTIDNNPIWLYNKRVYTLTSSQVRDERNVTLVSQLAQKYFDSATYTGIISADYKRKYLLKIGADILVYDYDRLEWYKWTGVPASVFLSHKEVLFFGTDKGYIHKFSGLNDALRTSNSVVTTTAITAYWENNNLDMEEPTTFKYIDSLVATFEGHGGKVYGLLPSGYALLRDTNGISQKVFLCRCKARHIISYGVKVLNDRQGENIGLTDLTINFETQGQARG